MARIERSNAHAADASDAASGTGPGSGTEVRRYGTIPGHWRRWVVGICLLLGVATAVGGLLVNWFTGTPVRWAWLMVAVGFAVGFIALYLWIRLSD